MPDRIALKYDGKDINPAQYLPIEDRKAYLVQAVTDFVMNVMDHPVAEIRLEKFLDKWDHPLDPAIRREIDLQIRMLLTLAQD